MNTIQINTKSRFNSGEVKDALQTDVFSANMLLLGESGSGRLVAVKNVIDQLLATGKSVLSIDLSHELSAYVNAAGGLNVPVENYSPETYGHGLINITFQTGGVISVDEFFTRLLSTSLLPFQFIVVESVELLFESLPQKELASLFDQLHENQTIMIASSNQVEEITFTYSDLVDGHFDNVLVFRSNLVTKAATLASGEALLKSSGTWKEQTLKFVPLAEEWERYAAVH